MKVIRIDDEDTKLTKRQQQKVAILKLTENGRYIEGVGIKDNEFFLLTEDDGDEMFLAHMNVAANRLSLTKDEVVKTILIMMKDKDIREQKAKLRGEEPPIW